MVAIRTQSEPQSSPGGRFNVLLTQDRDREAEHWSRQLPELMRPLGVRAYVATTGREALELVEAHAIHAALVDIATPSTSGGEPDGLWLLEVLKRRESRPPVIVINQRYAQRRAERLLNEALRLGAFTVINRPQHLEPLLQVIHRLVLREYKDNWPKQP